MRFGVATIIGVALTLGVMACSDFVGIGGDLDVDVVAEVRQDENTISFTAKNQSSETVYLNSVRLERHENGEWHEFGGPYIDILWILPIEPGDEHRIDWEIDTGYEPTTLPPGEYRFKLRMSEDHEANERLPVEATTSNAVRIERMGSYSAHYQGFRKVCIRSMLRHNQRPRRSGCRAVHSSKEEERLSPPL